MCALFDVVLLLLPCCFGYGIVCVIDVGSSSSSSSKSCHGVGERIDKKESLPYVLHVNKLQAEEEREPREVELQPAVQLRLSPMSPIVIS